MNKKYFSVSLFFIFLAFNILFAQNDNKYLQDLIDEAILVSPKIKVLKSKFKASEAGIEVGTNLPDPTLTFGVANLPTNSFSFTQEPMTGKFIGISQAIPFPGALSAASDVKAVDTSIVQQEIEDLKNQIRNDVLKHYFDIRLTRGEIELAKESEDLLTQISEVAKSKYEVSKASLHNIIQVEVQITRVRDKIEMLRGKEESLIAELNAILLRNEKSPILTDSILPIKSFNYTTGSLMSIAKDMRPFLKGIKYSEEKTKLMETQAEFAFYPNFKFGLQYNQRDYLASNGNDLKDLLSVVVGLTLPLNYGGNKSAKVNQAQYLQSLNRERYNSSLQQLQQSFGTILANIKELKLREKLVDKSLLPQAEQSLKAALADYQVAKIDFINVIKAEDEIIKVKTELINIRTKFYKNLAQLEFLTGKNLLNKN